MAKAAEMVSGVITFSPRVPNLSMTKASSWAEQMRWKKAAEMASRVVTFFPLVLHDASKCGLPVYYTT